MRSTYRLRVHQRSITMSRLREVTPFLRVPDIERAVAFFCDTLGFERSFAAGSYALVRRDDVAFRLIEDEALPPRGHGRYTSYVDVNDIDALYAEWKPKLDQLPVGSVCAPSDQDYGQRDLTVVGPDGDIIAFGSPIR
jgi:catechol 2,3-dioxygenase-like lactoylglutathione lyase family enzyme